MGAEDGEHKGLNLRDPKTAVGSLLARGLCVASVYLAAGGLLAQTEPNNVRRAKVKGLDAGDAVSEILRQAGQVVL